MIRILIVGTSAAEEDEEDDALEPHRGVVTATSDQMMREMSANDFYVFFQKQK